MDLFGAGVFWSDGAAAQHHCNTRWRTFALLFFSVFFFAGGWSGKTMGLFVLARHYLGTDLLAGGENYMYLPTYRRHDGTGSARSTVVTK